jgi:hypothetical protein
LGYRAGFQSAEREWHDAWVARWQDNKPVVFAGHNQQNELIVRNVGGGFAANVYLILREKKGEIKGVGALAAGHEIKVPVAIDNWLGSAKSTGFVIVAEGLATRTQRWNPTLNWMMGGYPRNRLLYPTDDDS